MHFEERTEFALTLYQLTINIFQARHKRLKESAKDFTKDKRTEHKQNGAVALNK